MLDRSLIIVSGKGGVGKSAVAAALALRAQRTGKRVLLSAMTDPVGTALHLGADRLGYIPTVFHGDIHAMAIDRSEALDEYMKAQLRIPAAAPTKRLSRALQVLVDTAPGVREIISMGKPIFDTWQGRYDIVIVDAPPLGQLMSYLRAPRVVAKLVPTGAIREQAARMEAALADDDHSTLVLVTTPEELPATETSETLAALAAETPISIGCLIANRVLPPLEISDLAALPDRPATAAAAHHLALLTIQHTTLAGLPIDVELPYLFGVHTPPEVAAQLADALEDSA